MFWSAQRKRKRKRKGGEWGQVVGEGGSERGREGGRREEERAPSTGLYRARGRKQEEGYNVSVSRVPRPAAPDWLVASLFTLRLVLLKK